MSSLFGVIAVFLLVAANAFFVSAEFSLVAVRGSRVAELVAAGKMNARALQRSLDNLDSSLAATQLGITISSLALGWVGEPALSHLVQPLLQNLPHGFASVGSHAAAVAISFIVITALHIVLGELAPKSLALQRSETTALFVVRPLNAFRFLLRPAIFLLNGLGNLVLRLVGLQPGTGEETLHSPEELKLLVAASHEAGLLDEIQHEVAERVFTMGGRRVGDIMTPRREIDWIDADADPASILRMVRQSTHDQLLVCRGNVDEMVGTVLTKDLLNQAIDGEQVEPLAVIRQPEVVNEVMTIASVLEQFKKAPVRLAIVVDEYGHLQGVVTQTDLLESLAGELADGNDGYVSIVERADGSLLIDGMMPAHEAFRRLGLPDVSAEADYHTVAGFALSELGFLPSAGEAFDHQEWRFEIVDMDGRRIDKLLATRSPVLNEE